MQIDWASNPNIRPACLPDASAGDYDQWMSTVTGKDGDGYNVDHYDDDVYTDDDCEDVLMMIKKYSQAGDTQTIPVDPSTMCSSRWTSR